MDLPIIHGLKSFLVRKMIRYLPQNSKLTVTEITAVVDLAVFHETIFLYINNLLISLISTKVAIILPKQLISLSAVLFTVS